MQESLDFSPTVTLDDLARLPAASTWVLTVNNRLARRLTLDLAQRARRERQVSELPRILPLSAWLVEAAQELSFDPQWQVARFRLDGFATQLLWRDVIRVAEADRVLLDMGQAAKLAIDADILMDEWAIHVPSGAETDEYRGFERWREAYRARLRTLDAEDANRGYAAVLDAVSQGALALPERVVLAGFSEISPRLARLLGALEERGTAWVRFEDTLAQPAHPQRYCAADHGAQWRAAAAWAAHWLDAAPEGRYAIVSTQLDADAPFARRVLTQALADEGGAPRHSFNVAVGRPLNEWPAVRAALAWLKAWAAMLQAGHAEPGILGAALLAGHCAGERPEAAARAACDAQWRRRALSRIDQARWRATLGGLPRLADAWDASIAVFNAAPAAAGTDRWGKILREALTALGFPGDASPDSVSFQVVGAFSDVLDQYAALSPAAGNLDAVHAVGLLEQLTLATVFQPQRDPLARLDVLGMLEAEGGHWDGVWVLGLTDDVLPASPKPNPLLPLAVLRQAGTPRATPERERLWAEGMFNALCRCAPTVIASYPAVEGERELRPSPLIAGLPDAADDLREILTSDRATGVAPLALASIQDDRGPPLTRATPTRGGLDVLEAQARNPQWAFVRHRLGGRALLPYGDAASVNVRGQFLHKALEVVWSMVLDQDRLHEAIGDDTLPGVIEQAVAAAADSELVAYPPALRALECARGARVLTAWFDVEAQREPFAIGEVEQLIEWRHGLLSLSVRLDRRDRLADGRSLIVDYKTGMAPLRPQSDWSRARPVNLQLPFYAAVLADGEVVTADDVDAGDVSPAHRAPDDVAGLILAQIHARRIAVQGLADTDLGIEGVTTPAETEAFAGMTWAAILARWRDAIHALADEYAAGHAPNIVLRPDDLLYCDALPFLRLALDDDDHEEHAA